MLLKPFSLNCNSFSFLVKLALVLSLSVYPSEQSGRKQLIQLGVQK